MASVSDTVARYYATKLAAHGPTPRGVDWNSVESQDLRFTKLMVLLEGDRGASVLDYGCGYGALATRLRQDGYTGDYVGYDVAPEMVSAAAAVHRRTPRCRFTSDAGSLAPATYAVASGIFNVRLQFDRADWERHVRETLDAIAGLGRRGFAFNMLTSHADADRMRPDLYYADPAAWLTYCLGRYSRHVALLHDYELYEFSVVVRTGGGSRG